MCVCLLGRFSHVRLFATPWTVARQAPLSLGCSRQEYWSGLPCPPPGDLPNPGIEPVSLMSPALAGGFFTISTNWESQVFVTQWCLTLCDPVDCSPPDSFVHGVLQERILPWLPFPSLGDLPDPEIKPASPALQAHSLPSEPPICV